MKDSNKKKTPRICAVELIEEEEKLLKITALYIPPPFFLF